MTKEKPNQKSGGRNLMKSGTSKRSRAGQEGKNSGMPRFMILAAVVIVGGAALLFWPRGGSVPTGIGERQSVIMAPDTSGQASSTADPGPRSSNVDIATESQTLVPESPDGSGLTPAEVTSQDNKVPVAKPIPKKKTKPATQPEERIIPRDSGGWAVQVGAFGAADNADKEALRLQAKGWDARIRAGNNSNGDMVFRVWIGYFNSRSVAETFARQNKKTVPNAIAVHR